MAGDEGFEPPNAGTRTQCLTTWRIPNEQEKRNLFSFPERRRGLLCKTKLPQAILLYHIPAEFQQNHLFTNKFSIRPVAFK